MTTIKVLIKSHPILSYFALTFVISWGGVLVLGAPYGMPATSDQANKFWPIVFLPFFLGPLLASLLLTGIVNGRDGFRELLSRLSKWRVNFRWYAVAFLTAPLLVTTILLVLSLTSSIFLPQILTSADKVGLLLTGLLVGLIEGGLMEELGWTGFAVPHLRLRYSVVTTGVIVGFLWGLWHILPTFWSSGNSSGTLDLPLFLPTCFYYIGVLPAYRILMVWVYDHTRSLLVAILMHAILSASTLFILLPPAIGVQLMTYYLILTTALWIAVAAVVMVNPGHVRQVAVRQTR
jgi:membrane protease YdiL (CAAX protease family)